MNDDSGFELFVSTVFFVYILPMFFGLVLGKILHLKESRRIIPLPLLFLPIINWILVVGMILTIIDMIPWVFSIRKKIVDWYYNEKS